MAASKIKNYDDLTWDNSIFCPMLTTKFRSEPNLLEKLNKTAAHLKSILAEYDILDIVADKYCPMIFSDFTEDIIGYCSENFNNDSLNEWIKIIQEYCETDRKFAVFFIRKFCVPLINKIISPVKDSKGGWYKKYLVYLINCCLYIAGPGDIVEKNEDLIPNLMSHLNDCCDCFTQTRIVELVIRLCSSQYLTKSLKKFHYNVELSKQFMAITREDFDVTARQFLNKLNAHNYYQRILSLKTSIGYLMMPDGSWPIQDGVNGQDYWLDFNWISETISFDANFGEKKEIESALSQLSTCSSEPVEELLTIDFNNIVTIRNFTWKRRDYGIYLDIRMSSPCICDKKSVARIISECSTVVFFIRNSEIVNILHEKLEQVFPDRYKDQRQEINANKMKFRRVESGEEDSPTYNKIRLQVLHIDPSLFEDEANDLDSGDIIGATDDENSQTSQKTNNNGSDKNSSFYQAPFSPNHYESEIFLPPAEFCEKNTNQKNSNQLKVIKNENLDYSKEKISQKSQNITCNTDISRIKLSIDSKLKQSLETDERRIKNVLSVQKIENFNEEINKLSSDSEDEDLRLCTDSNWDNEKDVASLNDSLEQNPPQAEMSFEEKLTAIENTLNESYKKMKEEKKLRVTQSSQIVPKRCQRGFELTQKNESSQLKSHGKNNIQEINLFRSPDKQNNKTEKKLINIQNVEIIPPKLHLSHHFLDKNEKNKIQTIETKNSNLTPRMSAKSEINPFLKESQGYHKADILSPNKIFRQPSNLKNNIEEPLSQKHLFLSNGNELDSKINYTSKAQSSDPNKRSRDKLKISKNYIKLTDHHGMENYKNAEIELTPQRLSYNFMKVNNFDASPQNISIMTSDIKSDSKNISSSLTHKRNTFGRYQKINLNCSPTENKINVEKNCYDTIETNETTFNHKGPQASENRELNNIEKIPTLNDLKPKISQNERTNFQYVKLTPNKSSTSVKIDKNSFKTDVSASISQMKRYENNDQEHQENLCDIEQNGNKIDSVIFETASVINDKIKIESISTSQSSDEGVKSADDNLNLTNSKQNSNLANLSIHKSEKIDEQVDLGSNITKDIVHKSETETPILEKETSEFNFEAKSAQKTPRKNSRARSLPRNYKSPKKTPKRNDSTKIKVSSSLFTGKKLNMGSTSEEISKLEEICSNVTMENIGPNIFLDETVKLKVDTDSEKIVSQRSENNIKLSQSSTPKKLIKSSRNKSENIEEINEKLFDEFVRKHNEENKQDQNLDIIDSVGLTPKTTSDSSSPKDLPMKNIKKSKSEINLPNSHKDVSPEKIETITKKRGRPRSSNKTGVTGGFSKDKTVIEKVLKTPKSGRRKKREDPDWNKSTPRKTRSKSRKLLENGVENIKSVPEVKNISYENSSDKTDENDHEVENILIKNVDKPGNECEKNEIEERCRSRSRSKTPIRLLNEVQPENIIDVDNNFDITYSDWGRPQRTAKTPTRLIHEVLRRSPHYFRSDDKFIFDDNTDNYALTTPKHKKCEKILSRQSVEKKINQNLLEITEISEKESIGENSASKSKRRGRSAGSALTNKNQNKIDLFNEIRAASPIKVASETANEKTRPRTRSTDRGLKISDNDQNQDLFDKIRDSSPSKIRENIQPKYSRKSKITHPVDENKNEDLFDQIRDSTVENLIVTKKIESKNEPKSNRKSHIENTRSNLTIKDDNDEHFDKIKDGSPQKSIETEKIKSKSDQKNHYASKEIDLTEMNQNDLFDHLKETGPEKNIELEKVDLKPCCRTRSVSTGSNLSNNEQNNSIREKSPIKEITPEKSHPKSKIKSRSMSICSKMTDNSQNADDFDKICGNFEPKQTRSRKKSCEASKNLYLSPPQSTKRIQSKCIDLASDQLSSKKGKRKLYNPNDSVPENIQLETIKEKNVEPKIVDIYNSSGDENQSDNDDPYRSLSTVKKGSKVYLRMPYKTRASSKVELNNKSEKNSTTTSGIDKPEFPKKDKSSGVKKINAKAEKNLDALKIPTADELFGKTEKLNELQIDYPSPPFTPFSQSSSLLGTNIHNKSRFFGKFTSSSQECSQRSSVSTRKRPRKSNREKNNNNHSKRSRKTENGNPESSYLDDIDNSGSDGKVLEIAMKHIMLNAEYIEEIFKKNKNSAKRTALYKKYCREKMRQLNESSTYFKLQADM